MKALILVDLENDFMPGGALGVRDADQIIPLIKEMIHYPFDVIVASKDWHPPEHGCFATNYEGKKVGDHIQLAGLDQILWPPHCVQETLGAEFAPGWDLTRIDKVIYKGTDPLVDSYSTFFDNGLRKSTGLENYLKDRGITDIYLAGLATEYCVAYSALDALKLGFHAYVIQDACRGINLQPNDVENALSTMQRAGVKLLTFKDLKDQMGGGRKKDRQSP